MYEVPFKTFPHYILLDKKINAKYTTCLGILYFILLNLYNVYSSVINMTSVIGLSSISYPFLKKIKLGKNIVIIYLFLYTNSWPQALCVGS